ALGNPALDLLGGIAPRVPLHHHHVLHEHAPLVGIDAQHAALLAAVAPGDYLYRVVLFDINRWHCSTSGGRETIFMNFLSRNSRATGPNTRVPTGSPISLIRTAALESNRMYVPSLRRVSLRVRTMTARTTLPFLILESGAASLTLAVTTSPR